MQNVLTEKSPRIEVIDVLRGFTLLGIIIVHFTEQYYAGQPPATHADLTAKNIADQVVNGLTGFFVQGKFFMIFSFLFGLSFFIQSNSSKQSSSFLLRFSWRLVILFLIGFIHHLHYRGDILTIYAILGFGLLIAERLSDKWLLAIALLLVFDIPAFGMRLYQALTASEAPSFLNPDQAALQAYYDALTTGSYIDILRANLGEFVGKFDFQIFSGRIFITMGLFMLGLYAGRKKFFERWDLQIDFVRKLGKRALWTLLGCVVAGAAIFGGVALAHAELSQAMGWAIGGLLYDALNASLATLYVVGVLLLYRKPVWNGRLMNLYAAGRMGLTTYLVQTVAGFLLFFSPGLGLLGKAGATLTLTMGLMVFAGQVALSKWWLNRFQYGPVEWLWRTLTYFKWQPFRKGKLQPAVTQA